MNNVEIFINDPVNANLDLNTEIDIALQYSIADIKDISKRNAAYSKTIILPGTKNNNFWFGNLFDVNSDFTMFNPNKKTSAKLIVNTEIVMDGFLQLRKIVKQNNTDNQSNLVNYECVIYNNAVDLMSVLGERSINELDMSEYGHTFSRDNIKASWNNTWEDGYVYPMYGLNNGANNYKVEYFYPAIFYKTILDQMVRQAGFGWTGSLATNEQFEKEVISYVTDGRPKISEDELLRRKFNVGRTQSVLLTIGDWPNGNPANPSVYPIIPNNPQNIQLNVDSGYQFFDNDNHWNTSLYEWTLDRNGKFTCFGQVTLRMHLFNNNPNYPAFAYTSDGTVFSPTGSGKFYLRAIVQVYDTTLNTWDGPNSTWALSQTEVIMPSGIPFGATISSIPVTFTFTGPERDMILNQRVRVAAMVARVNGTLVYINDEYMAGGPASSVNVKVTALGTMSNGNFGNFFRNEPVAAEFTQNEFINLAGYLPDKVKQKDLLTDLIRRYNLFIQTDPANPKNLIFDTRPDFYDRGTILDWTSKKDYSQPDDIELLSDLQFKKMIWTYKADSDEINRNYTEITGDVYGQYEWTFDNDFVKGENRVESSFSPTPIVKTAFEALVPAINPETPKVQPRIFYWGGLRDCEGWYWIYQTPTGATGASESFSTYPYAGHFDDPINPEIDINFGGNKFYFYDDWSFITDNNMYNTYWRDYVRQIETGRMVTSFFYLDEADVRFIKDNFYTKIFVLDSYYYINKIIDYKPLENGTTKVELIKIVDGIKWEPKRSFTVTRPRPVLSLNPVNEVVVGLGNSTPGGGGVVVGSGNSVGGKVSKKTPLNVDFIGPQKNMTLGDFNTNFGDRSFIVGDSNSISHNDSIILGGSNNVIATENVALINANGITATQSGKVYLGSNFIVDTTSGNVQVGSFSVVPLKYYSEDYAPISNNNARVYITSSEGEVLADFISTATPSSELRSQIYVIGTASEESQLRLLKDFSYLTSQTANGDKVARITLDPGIFYSSGTSFITEDNLTGEIARLRIDQSNGIQLNIQDNAGSTISNVEMYQNGINNRIYHTNPSVELGYLFDPLAPNKVYKKNIVSLDESRLEIDTGVTRLLNYDNATLQNVALIQSENISSDGLITLSAVGTTVNPFQDQLLLDPLNGSYLKSIDTTGATYAQINFKTDEIKLETYDTGGFGPYMRFNSTIIQTEILGSSGSAIMQMLSDDGTGTSGEINFSVDSYNTAIYYESDGTSVMKLRLVGIPSTASNTGEIWRDANNFLRIVP